MRICGIKLTHDGAIALVEDGRLVFCIEQEKRDNNPRYQTVDNLDAIVAALAQYGLNPRDIDQFVIDGWDGEDESQFQVLSGVAPLTLKGAPYVERHADGLLESLDGSGLILDDRAFPYKSYPHVTGHVASAYCTSPFANTGQPAFCLVWDGCIFPRLYYVDGRGARFLECLFPVIGQAYAAAGHYFGPYKKASRGGWDLGVAGKLMAYIALGSVDEDIVAVFQELYEEHFAADTELASRYRANITDAESSLAAVHDFFEASVMRLETKAPEDVLASFHLFLERLLVREMINAVRRHSFPGPQNLCIAGGCGLNIKWNSALRETGCSMPSGYRHFRMTAARQSVPLAAQWWSSKASCPWNGRSIAARPCRLGVCRRDGRPSCAACRNLPPSSPATSPWFSFPGPPSSGLGRWEAEAFWQPRPRRK